MQSWFPIPENSDFSIHNLPFGIFSDQTGGKRVGIAIGDHIIDLYQLQKHNQIPITEKVFNKSFCNELIALGKSKTNGLRKYLKDELLNENSPIKDLPAVFIRQSAVEMHLPVQIGDYTDFYSSIEHATNVGKMFRDPENALLPNWKHLPVGYHGRASSIIPSGKPILRPLGQTMPKGAEKPIFGPTKRLDFELEMGFVIGKESELGLPIPTSEAEEYIFGLVLFNDWSARDIQKWEYVPLGPFLGKNFASSISPWIVPLEALEHFRTKGPEQDPEVLPYLKFNGQKNYAIDLEVAIQPENSIETSVCRSNFKFMYWNMVQQLAHHTVNGCNVKVGDIMASGTISGITEDSFGSMLELSWAGSKEINLNGGVKRKFIEDGDTVIMRGFGQKEEIRVGFGEVRTKVLPAKS